MKTISPSQILLRGVLPAVLGVLIACPAGTMAQATAAPAADQDHIVSTQTLQEQVQDTAAVRQKNIETVSQFLSTPAAEKAMRDARVDAQQVRTAIPTLSDKELADVSARATNAQQEFAAGHIGPGLFTIIILAVIVIIIVAVVH